MIIAARTPSRDRRSSEIVEPTDVRAPTSTLVTDTRPVPGSRTTRTTVLPFTAVQTALLSNSHEGLVMALPSSTGTDPSPYVPSDKSNLVPGSGRAVSATAATNLPSRERAAAVRLPALPAKPGTGVASCSVTLTSDPLRSACSPTVALVVASGLVDATSAVVQPSA